MPNYARILFQVFCLMSLSQLAVLQRSQQTETQYLFNGHDIQRAQTLAFIHLTELTELAFSAQRLAISDQRLAFSVQQLAFSDQRLSPAKVSVSGAQLFNPIQVYVFVPGVGVPVPKEIPVFLCFINLKVYSVCYLKQLPN